MEAKALQGGQFKQRVVHPKKHNTKPKHKNRWIEERLDEVYYNDPYYDWGEYEYWDEADDIDIDTYNRAWDWEDNEWDPFEDLDDDWYSYYIDREQYSDEDEDEG